MVRQPLAPRGRGNPTLTAQEILHRRDTKLNSTNGRADQDWQLAVSNLPQEDYNAEGLQVLVLRRGFPHDEIPHPARSTAPMLHWRQLERRRGKEGTQGEYGFCYQPTVGKAVVEVSGAVRVEQDRRRRPRCTRARMDE
jgi:hypothetical protein